MPLQQVRSVNFGKSLANLTGSSGVGYSLIDDAGTVVTPRTTSGVIQLASGSGLYQSLITFPDAFRGSIIWDVNDRYATEQYNIEENNPIVDLVLDKVNAISGSVDVIRGMTEGRWIIEDKQMKFYDKDNSTLLAVFNLYDESGIPSQETVLERVRMT